jgi:hypothetical protein
MDQIPWLENRAISFSWPNMSVVSAATPALFLRVQPYRLINLKELILPWRAQKSSARHLGARQAGQMARTAR